MNKLLGPFRVEDREELVEYTVELEQRVRKSVIQLIEEENVSHGGPFMFFFFFMIIIN